jgi:hypothetical protein
MPGPMGSMAWWGECHYVIYVDMGLTFPTCSNFLGAWLFGRTTRRQGYFQKDAVRPIARFNDFRLSRSPGPARY